MAKNWRKILYCRQRVVITALLFAVLGIGVVNRHALPIAMMLLQQQQFLEAAKSKANLTVTCNITEANAPSRAPYQDKRGPLTYDWSLGIARKITYLYYVGYCGIHPVAGYLADRYGGKSIILVSVLMSSAFNFLYPALIFVSNGSELFLCALRIFYGCFDGLAIPAATSVSSHWVPLRERARLYSIMFSGFFMGAIITASATPTIIVLSQDWTVPFYVYGCVGILIFALWYVFGASFPDDSKFITTQEKSYLDHEMRGLVDHKKKTVPIKRILTTVDAWLFIIAMMAHLGVWHISMGVFKSYVKDVINPRIEISVKQAILPLFMIATSSCVVGFFSDWAYNHKYIHLMTLRKMFTNIGILGCPVYLVACTFTGCNVGLTHVLYMIALSFQGFSFCGIRIVAFDLSPNYAGFMTGFASSLGLFSGFSLSDKIMQEGHKNLDSYRELFYYMLGTCSALTLLFVVFGRTYLKDWNVPPERIKTVKK